MHLPDGLAEGLAVQQSVPEGLDRPPGCIGVDLLGEPGIIAATIGAFESLLSIGGTHPWWSLAIFALCVCILHGLIIYGEEEPAAA